MKHSISHTPSRVAEHTEPHINARIQRRIAMSILFHSENPDLIPRRLRELEAEWDIERALQTVSSTLTLAGLALSVRRGARWLALPIAVQGFFLQHAIQGWCPPLVLLRRAGFRTVEEIDDERHALRTLLQDSGGADEDNPRRRSANHSEVEMKPREATAASKAKA